MSTGVPSPPRLGQDRLVWVDSLRAIAALMVVLFHMPGQEVPGANILGIVGVNLFFVISGFVVPSSIDSLSPAPVRVFLLRRFWRLYPLYWFSIAVALLVAALVDPALVGGHPRPALVAANATMAQRFLGVPDIISVYWTLSIELIFYGLTLALFLAGVTNRPRRVTGILVLSLAGAVAATAVTAWTRFALPVGSMLFILLMLFGLWLRQGAGRERHAWTAAAAMLATQAFSCWLFYGDGTLRIYSGGEMFAKHALAVLLFMTLRRRAIMEWGPLAYVGRISYSLYLLHMPVIWGLGAIMGGSEIPGPWRAVPILAAVLAVSAAAHAWVEVPAQAMGRRMTRFPVRPAGSEFPHV